MKERLLVTKKKERLFRAGAGSSLHLMDAFHVELVDCLMDLQAAGSSGMSNTIAETDSIMVESALETRSF